MKIIVVGMHSSGKQDLFEQLMSKGLKCGKLFSNKDINDIRYDFYSDRDINELFENRAYMFIKEINGYTRNSFEGLSLYEYDNNDIFVLSPDQFSAISTQLFTEDICLFWLDDSKTQRKLRYEDEKRTYDFNQIEEFERAGLDEFINTIYNDKLFHVIYFNNEDIDRVGTIIYASSTAFLRLSRAAAS